VEARQEPFDSNGRDDSFAIARSRPQGPVIRGSAVGAASRTLSAAELPVGDPATGTFGPQVTWPIMPIHAVLLPDGRVLSYGTDRNGAQTAYYDYDVWDPRAGTGVDAHVTLPNGTATDIFCSAQLVLLSGDVELYGGDNLPANTNTYNREVTQFRPASDTLVHTGSMNRLRWYSTSTMLPNSEVYIQGGSGGADFPEVRAADGQFRLLTGASTSNLSSGYPKNFVAPDGLVFGLAKQEMYRVNPAGTGSITSLGTFPTDNVGATSTSVMFAPGRILQVGGGAQNAASRNASIIDINGSAPQVSALPQAQYGRHWGNATVMADGRVLVSGGSAVNNAATGVTYTTEIFNPSTNTWSTGATATRMRLYHSTSLLLPDATVITMGGGTPGPETNLNAEIYYPPYLFNAGGSEAVRPTITSATALADPGTNLTVNTPDAAGIARVTLVKSGSVTHSIDMDQRFLDLPFTSSAGALQATLPANVHETPPGHYLLFVINAAGVPSLASFVKIGVEPPPPPPPTSLVINGGFEDNSVPAGSRQLVSDLTGWRNRAGPVEVWRGYNGLAAGEGASNIELDEAGRGNRVEQVVTTQSGRLYTLSFLQSPRPGVGSASNAFDVYWGSARLGTVSRSGVGLAQTSWQTTTFTVTGSGQDKIQFRENDRDSVGGLIDDVRLIPG